MEVGRTIRVKKEKVTKVMNWGESDPAHFFNTWENEIKKMDPNWHTFIHDLRGLAIGSISNIDLARVFPNNVYRYLFAKVVYVVNTKKGIGEVGWAFAQAEPNDYVCGMVWADGTHEQSSPLAAPRAGERWWPCIFLKHAYSLEKPSQRAFYCPALAWQASRPWPVHTDRVRIVETPGPVIEEIPEDMEVDELPDGWTILI